jgi:hypothetical protein
MNTEPSWVTNQQNAVRNTLNAYAGGVFESIEKELRGLQSFGNTQRSLLSLSTIRNTLFGTSQANINVTDNKDYIWRIPRAPRANEVPSIILRQYEVTSNSTFAYLQSAWAKIASTINDLNGPSYLNPYASTYAAMDTGVIFQFPYLSEYLHTTRVDWVTNELAHLGEGWIKTINQFTNISPAISMNAPMTWNGTSSDPYTVKFCLFNTNQTSSVWYNHWKLLHNQYTFVNSVPPAIYTVDIPGMKYSPASYMKTLKISNLGNTMSLKHINNGAGALVGSENSLGFPSGDTKTYMIPDAYAVEITFEDMIPMSRQILYHGCGIGNGDKQYIKAITDHYPEVETLVGEDFMRQLIPNATGSAEPTTPIGPLR